MADHVSTIPRRPHPAQQPGLGARSNELCKDEGRSHEEDGGLLRTVHGQHEQHNTCQEGQCDKGQGHLGTLHEAVEVDGATRSFCHVSMLIWLRRTMWASCCLKDGIKPQRSAYFPTTQPRPPAHSARTKMALKDTWKPHQVHLAPA